MVQHLHAALVGCIVDTTDQAHRTCPLGAWVGCKGSGEFLGLQGPCNSQEAETKLSNAACVTFRHH